MAKHQNHGKMKLWRREARQHNLEDGGKNNGRKYRSTFHSGPPILSGLMAAVFVKAGFTVHYQM